MCRVDFDDVRRDARVSGCRITAPEVAVAGGVVGQENVRRRIGRDARGQGIQFVQRRKNAAVEHWQLDQLVGAERGGIAGELPEYKQYDFGCCVRDQRSGG